MKTNYKNININTSKNTHDKFLLGDMTEPLPIENDSCDTVVCIDGIEHISRQFDFTKDVHRIRKSNWVELNKEVFRQIFTKSVLFGETLIVKAIKQ